MIKTSNPMVNINKNLSDEPKGKFISHFMVPSKEEVKLVGGLFLEELV